jgi:hypothetical protein
MVVWTQQDIDTLKAAVASGILTVHYAGPPARSITYQSLKDMLSLLASMNASTGDMATYRLAATRKGV